MNEAFRLLADWSTRLSNLELTTVINSVAQADR